MSDTEISSMEDLYAKMESVYHIPQQILQQITNWCTENNYDFSAMEEDISEPEQSFLRDFLFDELIINTTNANTNNQHTPETLFSAIENLMQNKYLPIISSLSSNIRKPNILQPKPVFNRTQSSLSYNERYPTFDDIPIIKFLNASKTEIIFYSLPFAYFEDVRGILQVLKYNSDQGNIEHFYDKKFEQFIFISGIDLQPQQQQLNMEQLQKRTKDLFETICRNLNIRDGELFEFLRCNPPFDRIECILEKIVDQLSYPMLKPIILQKSEISEVDECKNTDFEQEILFLTSINHFNRNHRKYSTLFKDIPLDSNVFSKRVSSIKQWFDQQCPGYFNDYDGFVHGCLMIHENELDFDGNSFDLLITLSDMYDRFLMIHGYLYCKKWMERFIMGDIHANRNPKTLGKYHTSLLNLDNQQWFLDAVHFVRTKCLSPMMERYYITNDDGCEQQEFYSGPSVISKSMKMNSNPIIGKYLINDDFYMYEIYSWAFLHFLMNFSKDSQFKFHTYNHNLYENIPANNLYSEETGIRNESTGNLFEPKTKSSNTNGVSNGKILTSVQSRVVFHNVNFPLQIDLLIIPRDFDSNSDTNDHVHIPLDYEKHFGKYSNHSIGYCKMPIKSHSIHDISDMMSYCFRRVITNAQNWSYYDTTGIVDDKTEEKKEIDEESKMRKEKAFKKAARKNKRRRDDRYIIIIDRRIKEENVFDTICAYPPYFKNFEAKELLKHRRHIKVYPTDKRGNPSLYIFCMCESLYICILCSVSKTKNNAKNNTPVSTKKVKPKKTVETQHVTHTQNRYSLIPFKYTEMVNFYLTHKCILPNFDSMQEYIGMDNEVLNKRVVCMSAHFHQQKEFFPYPLLRIYQYLPCGSARFFLPDIENLWRNIIRNEESVGDEISLFKEMQNVSAVEEVRTMLKLEKCDERCVRWRHSFVRDFQYLENSNQ